MIGIYMITNKINNKKYIGQSINIKRRKSEHFYKKCDMVISRSIFKHGKENFDFKILELCEESQLNELEIKYITQYKSNNRVFGYNVDNGGNCTGKMSEETKQKLSEANKGEKNAFYGKKHTEEVKNKIREHHKNNENYAFHNKKHSVETLQKMRNNDWNGKGKGMLYTNTNGNYITNFNGKRKCVTINKYPNLGIPLIICTRICMENEIDFKSNLVKDMEHFVQNFNLKDLI